ncbi:MAG TPA: ABC transporter ATP-binding protein [Acidimicrobiia bacterium]|nr:ABC transporter ATP-binding protein [Acidimicrobiia bacterium]
MTERVLTVDELTVSFGTRTGVARVVNGISYHVDRGETLAIVGESGSGKSVSSLALLQLLPTPPARVEGTATFGGADLLSMSDRDIRRVRGNQIAMIFQDPMTSLNPVRTVGHQIIEPIELHLGLHGKAARKRAIDLLETVGIPAPERRIDDYPHQFSGGMRQRVMIAIGISCEPDVLIADEATTALDVTTQAQIVEEMESLQDRLGMALIWITHDLGVVAGIADRVVVLYGGRIMEEAAVDELYRQRRHPYTRGLLESLPTPGIDRPERLHAIPGLPPDPARLPPGCPFQPRCEHAVERCSEERPEYREPLPGHRVACHFEPAELYGDSDV